MPMPGLAITLGIETVSRRLTALHIPDGFLTPPVAFVFLGIGVAMVALAARRAGDNLGERQIPLMGIMAAFIFAAQMINFPVAGGTSGHLLGGALAAVVLGPWSAMLVMTAVIVLQGLLFQDGGLLAMGANVFNMGLLTAVIGYGLYRLAAGRGRSVTGGTVAVAAWLSVMAAALFASLELWLSGTSSLRVVLPAMLGVHALIGIGEALVTVAAVMLVTRVRPDLVAGSAVRARGSRAWAIGGVLAALSVVLLAPYASADPDGLERVAHDLGLTAARPTTGALLPDYTMPGLAGHASTIAAGLVGAILVAGLAVGLGRLLRRRRPAA
jgi:cobalt/nickel transport system permease protein